MRGAIASLSTGGSSALPVFGSLLSAPGPIRREEFQISNRDTKRLETPVTQTKQTIGRRSNRYKNGLFHGVFVRNRRNPNKTNNDRKLLIQKNDD